MNTNVCLVNETYDEVVRNFEAVTNKLVVNVIKILDTPIGVLGNNLLSSFKNLIDLELSNCAIFTLENDVFMDLRGLTIINLSDNSINSIDNNLFETNSKLKTIIFKNNLLYSVSNMAQFSKLHHLEELDLSYNHLSFLNEHFLDIPSLSILRLNNNYIKSVNCSAFQPLAELTYLNLENNLIDNIESNLFVNLTKLQYLNLNNNRIQRLHPNSFWELKEINSIYLKSNCLTHRIYMIFFIHNSKLVDIDLSDNEISLIDKCTFDDCRNLKFLKLKVCGRFQINSIRNLTSLTKFELVYLPHKLFWFSFSFWGYFKNKPELTVLKIIIKHVDELKLCDFSSLTSLQHLHIEFLKPNDTIKEINFYSSFHKMRQLRTLILKRLNGFCVSKCFLGAKNVTHLDLTGVTNKKIDYGFQNFVFLTYLNLSFSEIAVIYWIAFESLVLLEYLDLESAKLKHIFSNLFANNTRLRLLNFLNCRIEMIEDGSFANLHSLEVLDLRNNLLKHVSENAFFGLNRQTCHIFL